MKKHLMSKILLSAAIIALGFIIGASVPMNTYVVNAANTTTYVSEVKIGIGKTEEEASRDLLSGGYTILKKDGKYADLNEDAGVGGMGPGQKIVYMGYKTTTKVEEAVTDLAVMNMKGGYSIRDYEVLMENQLKTQVLPFVNRFIATLDEYRNNLKWNNLVNKARAEYMRSMLNKMVDDDTGMPLGDLLMNQTKFEMGDEAYNKLSASEKKKHADIVTIIMQANGKSTLSMETLLTKASDSAETSWIDRLQHITLDSLKDQLVFVDITEQDSELDKLYYDNACKILEKWDSFYEALMDYDEKINALANVTEDDNSENIAAMQKYDPNSSDVETNGAAMAADLETRNEVMDMAYDLEIVAAYERLDEIEYESDAGYTLLDFFSQESSAFDGDDIRNLYPLVASLSAGQIAGLDFLSLQDLVTIATADATSYDLNELGDIDPASIYEGVNREVFQKGMVALTNAALRAEAAKNDVVTDFAMSTTNYVLWGATALATAGMVASFIASSMIKASAKVLANKALECRKVFGWYSTQTAYNKVLNGNDQFFQNTLNDQLQTQLTELVGADNVEEVKKGAKAFADKVMNKAKSSIATYLSAAFTVAMAVLAAYSIYSTIKELMDYYKVDYSPIPKYMVEETDITTYNAKGEKVVLKNNSAYYKVVECNRPSDDKNYEVLQNYADLNGDVGKQWLALYSVKFEGKSPIIASSLKVVTGSTALPDGYSTGIHKFGETAAFDLNSAYYVFNKEATDVYVYFKTDDSVTVPVTVASAAGSNFTVGSVFLYGGIGAAIGAGVAVAVLLLAGRKKEGTAANA